MITMTSKQWHDIYTKANKTFWSNLAVAIIFRACMDYEQVLIDEYNIETNENGIYRNFNRNELEQFFDSDWYQVLTDIDPKALKDRIQKLAKDHMNNQQRIGRDVWMSSLFC